MFTLAVLLLASNAFAAQGFDYQSYLSFNSDLPQTWTKAQCMEHYRLFGFNEKRAVSFNLEEYLNANPDLPTTWTYEQALAHYNAFGKSENRLLAFSADEYLSLYPDLPQYWNYDQAYAHYIYFGKQEGRIASFDETAYLEIYADLPQTWNQTEAFYHYLLYGRYEGRIYDPYDETVFKNDSNATTTFYRDADGDGYGNPISSVEALSQPDGYVLNDDDCNDFYSSIHPGATETCGDYRDSDCDSFDCLDDDDYSGAVTVTETVGSEIQYDVEVFNNAKPSAEQIDDSKVPLVVEELGKLLVLDISTWPNGWDVGRIIKVRMPDGIIEYKRILMRFELEDSRLAIGALDSSVLEVLSEGTVSIDGELDTVVSQQATSSAYPVTGYAATKHLVADDQNIQTASNPSIQKIVDVVDFKDSRTIYLLDESNLNLYSYNNDGISVDLSLPEVSLSISPKIEFELVIDKPPGLSDLVGAAFDYASKVSEATFDMVDQIDGQILGEGHEIVIVNATADTALDLLDHLSASNEVIEKLGAIQSVLTDISRIKLLHASLSGPIEGTFSISASASASYSPDEYELELATLLIPITGPIPLFLQFKVVGVADMTFDSEISVSTGVDIHIPINFSIDVIDGVIQKTEKPDMTPQFNFISPSFEGSKAGLELSAGIQVETGLTVAKILSAHIDPTISVVFDANADLYDNIDSRCVDLNWDVFARLNAELEAELNLLVTEYLIDWDIPLEYTLFENEWPKDNYSWCWNYNVGNGSFDSAEYIGGGGNRIVIPTDLAIDSIGDEDFYSFDFEIKENHVGYQIFDLTGLTGNLDIELYDSDRNLLASSNNAGTSDEMLIWHYGGSNAPLALRTPGITRLYIRVFSPVNEISAYNLQYHSGSGGTI